MADVTARAVRPTGQLDLGRALKRVPRWARIAMTIVLASYVLYMIGGNVLLGTGLLRRALDSEPDK